MIFGDTIKYNTIPFGVMSGFISTDQSPMSLPFKTEYIPEDVVRFVNIFDFQYEWKVKDE
jgi:hypothetical protein